MMSQQLTGDRKVKVNQTIFFFLGEYTRGVFDNCILILTVPECTKPLVHILLAVCHKVHDLCQITNL